MTETDDKAAARQAGGERKAEGAPDRPRRRCRRIRTVLAVIQWAVNLCVLAAILLVFTPAGDWVGRKLTRIDPLAEADYIVVLGGDTERAVEAARLYAKGWAPKVIVSARGDDAADLARILRDFRVPPGAILLDALPTRTIDHPRTVAAVGGVDPRRDRFIIVTSPYHTTRSRACFERGGYKHILVRAPSWQLPGPLSPEGMSWGKQARDLFCKTYEVLAWAYYKARGRL